MHFSSEELLSLEGAEIANMPVQNHLLDLYERQEQDRVQLQDPVGGGRSYTYLYNDDDDAIYSKNNQKAERD